MKHSGLFIITVLIALSDVTYAKVSLPAIFSDNMVLQQNSDINIWGWAKPGTQVSLNCSWDNEDYSCRTMKNGKWKIKVKTPAYGGPYSIIISDGEPETINNVLIGEVWLCSGQSNMEMPVKGYSNQPVEGALNAIVISKNSKIRLFKVGKYASLVAEDNCEGVWAEASPETVCDFSATAYFFGRLLNDVLDIPVGIIQNAFGGSGIETWMSINSLKGTGIKIPATISDVRVPNKKPTVFFNGMIHPIIGYGIRGVIWYQGEGNHKTPESYADLMKRMVAEWRNLWDIGDFPFYYVQIAPWQEYGVNSALLREAQLKALELIANSGIVINMDANSPYCVHPPNKKQVGERLACLALAKTYQMKGIPCNSPSLVSVDVKGQLMELTFDVPDNIGLTSDVNEIKGFKIAGNDRVFYHATATIYKNKVIILAPEVSEPVAIRYAFDNASPSEIFSLDGLPVSSFRTDNW